MFPGNDPPRWLFILSIAAIVAAFFSAGVILIDIVGGHRQKMGIMDAVWPITGLYMGPLAVWAYWSFGGASGEESPEKREQNAPAKPFWQIVFTGACHCGAGCTLGDFAGEWLVFFAGFSIASSVLYANFIVDFICAYWLGIVFQYYAIAPMRNISGWPGIVAAVKADTVSLVSFEIGMFAWMWFSNAVLFQPRLEPTNPIYWFSMQIAMVVGFATAYPANWWLIKQGWKEKM